MRDASKTSLWSMIASQSESTKIVRQVLVGLSCLKISLQGWYYALFIQTCCAVNSTRSSVIKFSQGVSHVRHGDRS